ncbi:unnamed protein product [Caenorhabditis brenneri]
MVNLDSLPDTPIKEICKHSDLKAILNLRKVSSNLINQMNQWSPDLKIDKIWIVVKESGIEMKIDSGDESWTIDYKPDSNGCIVEHDDSEKLLSNEDFMDVFFTDLEIILKNRNSVLQSLSFKMEYTRFKPRHPSVYSIFVFFVTGIRQPLPPNDDNNIIVSNYYKLLGMFKNISKSDARLIRVVSVQLYVWDYLKALEILPYLNPKYLKSIELKSQNSGLRNLEMDKISRLEQFKQATEFNAIGTEITVNRITSEDLFVLKEMFIKLPNFKHCFLSYRIFEDPGRLFELFNGYQFDLSHVSWCMERIPKTNEILIIIFMGKGEIKFRKCSALTVRKIEKDLAHWIY